MGIDKLPEIVTVKQLAEFLQVTELTIRRALTDKRLKGFKIGRDWRIVKEEVVKWISDDKEEQRMERDNMMALENYLSNLTPEERQKSLEVALGYIISELKGQNDK